MASSEQNVSKKPNDGGWMITSYAARATAVEVLSSGDGDIVLYALGLNFSWTIPAEEASRVAGDILAATDDEIEGDERGL